MPRGANKPKKDNTNMINDFVGALNNGFDLSGPELQELEELLHSTQSTDFVNKMAHISDGILGHPDALNHVAA